MRELIVSTFLSLDGVMQAPGGPGEDDDGGFAYGGWSVNYWDDRMGQVMEEATSRPFAMVLGRKTYDIMAAYWPTAPEEEGGRVFNEATKYVAIEQLCLSPQCGFASTEEGNILAEDEQWAKLAMIVEFGDEVWR